MKARLIVLSTALALSVVMLGCAEQREHSETEFAGRIYDVLETRVESGAATAPVEEQNEPQDAQAEETVQEPETEATWAYSEPETFYEPIAFDVPSEGLTMQGGVNYHDGRTETWYSSNVLYHYRTGEWSVDDEGFYRTDEGYYVVAASDMPQGTVFEGSKGECVVLDSGCAEGVTDYYVAW